MSNITRNRLTNVEFAMVFQFLKDNREAIETLNLHETCELIESDLGIKINEQQAGKYRVQCGYSPRWNRKPEPVAEPSDRSEELLSRIITLEKNYERLIVKLVQTNVL